MDHSEFIDILRQRPISTNSYISIAENLYEGGDKEEIFSLYRYRLSKETSEITEAERRILRKAYKDVHATREKKIETLQKRLNELNQKDDEPEKLFLKSYLHKAKDDIVNICVLYTGLLEQFESLTSDQETKLYYVACTAYVHDDAAKLASLESQRNYYKSSALRYFKRAKTMAERALTAIDIHRLRMIANYAIFMCTTMNQPDVGCKLAEEALANAYKELYQNPVYVSKRMREILDYLEDIEADYR